MKKLTLAGLLGLLLLVLAACGPGAQPAAKQPAAKPPAAPAVQPPPAVAPEAKMMTPVGAPGAVYMGKLEDLAGPVSDKALGDDQGNVPLDSLQRHLWIYGSDYYKKLIQTAKLDNPTPLVTKGKKFKLQYACINRTLTPCILINTFFAPNVLKRTEGQVEIQVVGYPELSIAGPDTLRQIKDGTLSMGEIYGGYVSGDLPVSEIFYFWGLYPSHEAEFKAQEKLLPEVDKIISKATGDGVLITHNWYMGNDQFFFSRKPLRTLADFKGVKARSHGTTLSDAINGLGGDAQFVAFAETYTALERGVLDAAVSGATAGWGLKWYEVAKYIVGPYRSFPADFILINKGVWAQFPPDIQQILIEEGAKNELEGLRVASIVNELGLTKNTKSGMEHIPFSPELQEYAFENAILKRMIPNWVKRAGGPTSESVKLFNDIIAPIAGVQINPDGTASKVAKPY